jgi:hypothetical protein
MKKHLILPLLLWAAMGFHAQAATLEGLQFEDQVRLANRDLRLNGLGVRAVFIFKAFVAGLYLGDRASVGQDAVHRVGPKRLQLRMLMEIGSEDIKKALVDGLRKHVTEAQWTGMQDRAAEFSRTIEAIGVARPGDTISLDYVPDRGMTLSVNEVARGSAIVGQDFYDAVLEIFVGDDPVDTRLKKGLLGQ